MAESKLLTRNNIQITDAVINEILLSAAKLYKCPLNNVMLAYSIDAKFMLFINGELKAMFDKESYDVANNVQPGIIIPGKRN